MGGRHPRQHGQDAGFTFAELAFGLLILVLSAVVLINHLAVNYQMTQGERDRVFAFSKAQAILSEIQSHVDRGGIEAVDLDTMDDGVLNKFTLSIQTDDAGELIPADHVVSGNFQRNGEWMWSRRITVQPFAGAGNRNVRYVTVRIYRKDLHGEDRSLADLSAVVNSSGEAFPSTQVYDLYLFAIENIPGWWVYMDSIRPFMESMITDLETRNPGLEFRTHWITKASFGRNQAYRPYTNDVADSTATIPDVYNYPGRMPTGSASAFYYVPDNIKARINVEGLERNGHDGILNPHPYALADFFNHAMRYPDELALWRARVAAIEARETSIDAAVAGGSPPPAELGDMSKEPTLRLFLEDLYSSPDKYKNALVVNLHGELLPMPALRNFCDPAKSQVAYPNLRVVTHPEELRTKHNDGGTSDSMMLRMYAFGYQTSANHYLTPPSGPAPSPVMADPMVVELVGLNLTDSSVPPRLLPACTLSNVRGGVPVGGSSDYATTWSVAKHSLDGPVANEMYYTVEYVAPSGSAPGFTRIYLFNTPVGAPPVVTGGMTYGLAATERARLYQMEYIPCPVSTTVGTPSFTPDLTSAGEGPKNTARWTLRLAPSVLAANPVPGDFVMQVRTRIVTGNAGFPNWRTSGTVLPTLNDPDNLSVTYAWWTDSKEDVPFTERAQFNGDPRHLPYKDCFNGGDDFPNSFNWYLDSLANATSAPTPEPAIADFPCLVTALSPVATPLRNRWAGALACDVPRYLQLLREGLVRSRCVYSSLTGWSYYYLGLGNDIGYDSANGYPASIPTDLTPYGSLGSWGHVDTIIGARRYVRAPGAAGTNYWWGMPWLGELVPDSHVASDWLAGGTARGNLAAGTAPGRFFQATCNSAYAGSLRQAYGTALVDNIQRMANFGCTTLFNIGTAASTFQHSSSNANGSLTAKGAEIAGNYNMAAPSSAPISRPFRINVASGVAEHWTYAPYATKYTASLFQTYYTHTGGAGSAVVKLVDPTGSSAAYVVVNGIANTVTNGTPFIAQWNLLSLVHTLLEAGEATNTMRIQEQPRIEIVAPIDITELDDPSSIEIQFSTEWARWDGLPYAATGTFTESEAELEYAMLYSRDGGTTWRHVQDESAATPGVRPGVAHLVVDAGAGNETYDWDVSAGFPEGTYMLRVDCFRQGASVHQAYHQTRLFIQR